MDADLSQPILDARNFLSKLKANNNRDWFQDHKKDYEAAIKHPGQAIGVEMTGRLSTRTGREMTHKLFRINRDVRFSKDKTPYNTHLHLLWADGSGPGFFFGVSADYVTAGCGLMNLEKDALDRYRTLIDETGEDVQATLSALIQTGHRMDEPPLKRVPSPYPKDHPHGKLLRRKSFAVWRDLAPQNLTTDGLSDAFEALMPVYQFCCKIG